MASWVGSKGRRHALFVAAVIALFAGLTTVIFWLQGGFRGRPTSDKYTHLHCPQCSLELLYSLAKEGKPCPQCGETSKLVPTIGAAKGGAAGEVGRTGKIVVSVFIAAVLVQGLVYGWFLHLRARRRAEEESQQTPLVCHCPFCSRKIGYPIQKVGAGAVCPRCKTAFVLPEGEPVEL